MFNPDGTPYGGASSPTDVLVITNDDLLVDGWSVTETGDNALRLYKQGGRAYLTGVINTGDEPDYVTPVFVVPEEYAPETDVFDAADFIIGSGYTGIGVAQFYSDVAGFGLYNIFATTGNYAGSGKDMRFGSTSWPIAS